jgi:hypothetical protein
MQDGGRSGPELALAGDGSPSQVWGGSRLAVRGEHGDGDGDGNGNGNGQRAEGEKHVDADVGVGRP